MGKDVGMLCKGGLEKRDAVQSRKQRSEELPSQKSPAASFLNHSEDLS